WAMPAPSSPAARAARRTRSRRWKALASACHLRRPALAKRWWKRSRVESPPGGHPPGAFCRNRGGMIRLDRGPGGGIARNAACAASVEGVGAGAPKDQMARQDQANDQFSLTSFLYGGNADYIETLYAAWQESPDAVDPEWQEFFSALKDDAGDVRKSAEGASWTRSNWPLQANGELVSALDGDWGT